MTLQALKEAEFETSSLRVVPVTPGRVNSLAELPLVSYAFINGTLDDPAKIFYNVQGKRDDSRHHGPTAFRSIGRQMVNFYQSLGVRLDTGRHSYWSSPTEFLGQTMQNLYSVKERANPEGGREHGAAMHGRGHVYVQLPQGGALRIRGENDTDMDHWDVIIEGEINFFGEVRPFTITHAHCQGFEFPDNIDVIMEEVMAAFFAWFSFASKYVAVINAKYVSNPVTHQDHL